MFSKKKSSVHVTETAPVMTDCDAPTSADDAAMATGTSAPADTTPKAAETQKTAEQACEPTDSSAPTEIPDAQELILLKDRFARLLADFDNYRKRQARDREDLIKRANEDLLVDLLPVIDHLELALAQSADPASPFVVGVKLVYDQFLTLLDRYGMKPLDAKNEPFDPACHEALSQMSSATVPANIVMDQFRRGWLLGGRLLRPAQVIVSSGAPESAKADAEPSNVTD